MHHDVDSHPLTGEIKGPTRVVCPAAAMLQWRNEILRFTQPGIKNSGNLHESKALPLQLIDVTSQIILWDVYLLFVCFLFGVSKPFNDWWWHNCLGFLSPPNEGSIDVRLFYGTEKKDVLCDLMDDKVFVRRVVVLTTYQTLESDYRRQVNLTKVTCEWCGRLFQKSKLFYHQKYFCGPDAQRTEKQMKSQRKADYKEKSLVLRISVCFDILIH